MDLLTGAAEPAPTPPAPPALLAPSTSSLTSTFGSSAQVSFLNIAFTGLPLSYYDVQKFRHETMNLPGPAPAAPETAQPPTLKSATNAASSLFGSMRKQIAASTQNIAFKALAHTTSSSFKDTILATVTLTTTSSSNSSVTLEPISLNPEFSQMYNLYKTCMAVPPSCTDISIKLTLSSGAGKSAGALGSAIAGVDFPLGSIELDSSKIAELTSSQEVLKELVIGEGSDYWKEKGEVHARLLNPPSTTKPGQPGWSLTDPTPESPNITSTFCFNSLEKEQTIFTENDVVVAVERSRESTIVLPVAAAVSRLLSEGAATSSAHSWLLAQAVRRRNGIFVDKEDAIENNHAACCAKISGFTRNWADGEVSVKNPDSGSCIVRISLQPLGCVFAKELLSFETSIYNSHGHATSNSPPVDVDFFPHVEFNSHNEHNRVQLGSLRFEVTWGKGSFAEGVLPLDSWVSKCAQNDGTCSNVRVKLSDVHRKAEAGTINLDLSIVVGDASNKRDISGSVLPNPITGLVNMVNLGHLGSTQLDKPVAVCEQPGPIGDLLQSDWLEEHAQQRAQDSSLFSKYASTFKNYTPTEDEAGLHSSKRRYPSNFKPSAAKADKNLTPIAINVHNQTFSMQTVDGQEHPRQVRSEATSCECDNLRE
ncbi:hypothetical protein TL16_g06534 [Triparma laevis f. inornata]|uniref:Uncharacterized protein n=1 Tax=Triparma laevis f. inornata TaxID=1714386 RepID=A0A9W7EDC4_9STRA|nr:hypothetical protein TL16_g06534 [Triparma laevis f. inornata]